MAYTCLGTLSPDATCNYFFTGGQEGGRDYFDRIVAGWSLWWDGTDTWTISAVVGTQGTDYWELTQDSPVGVYTPGGTATGDATIVLGETSC